MRIYLLICSFMIITLARAQKIEIPTIDDFDISKYLGTWYEIARMDHVFERGLICVTANYTMRSDDKIQVLNSGYSVNKNCWTSSDAVAKTTDIPNRLKVYFFPLIGAQYNVVYIDSLYSVAIVSGGSKKYLWFMSRTPHISLEQRDKLISVAQDLGYNTNELLYVSQDRETLEPK